MTAHLLERGLNPPAPDEAAKDRLRFVVEVGAEKGLRLAPAGGSRTSIQRIGAGGRPAWYQIAVLETISSTRLSSPYHSLTHTRVHRVAGLASTAVGLGRGGPLRALGPRWAGRGGVGGGGRAGCPR